MMIVIIIIVIIIFIFITIMMFVINHHFLGALVEIDHLEMTLIPKRENLGEGTFKGKIEKWVPTGLTGKVSDG